MFAQSTFQVCLRNFYKSTIINWKIMRTTSKLAQVFHIFKIQSNQILFEFQSFFKYSVVGTDPVTACCYQPFLDHYVIVIRLNKKNCLFPVTWRTLFLLADPFKNKKILPLLVEKSLYPFWGHSSFRVIHWETIVTKVHSQMLMAMKSGWKIYTQNVT